MESYSMPINRDKDEDDDSMFDSPFIDGHWEWDTKNNKLVFVNDATSLSLEQTFANIVGPVEFKDNLDLLEQLKFKKRVQRKPEGVDDVVTLQDVKDLVMYTAPVSLLSPMMINIMHQPTTERFLRALILYCQYYGQVSVEMVKRAKELESKIYTENSSKIESVFQENLEDLRLLVAKEYSTMILGGADFKNFHHKGMQKKSNSLSRRECRMFESLIRLSIHIVWIALGRKWFDIIEYEINRLFRSKKFNTAKRKIEGASELCEYTMSRESGVFTGKCVSSPNPSTLKIQSPMFNEFLCDRKTDYRLLGLGIIKYPKLNNRLIFLETMLVARETQLRDMKQPLGILGLPRSGFDTMLHEIRQNNASKRPSVCSFRMSVGRINLAGTKIGSDNKVTSKTSHLSQKLIPDLVIPSASIQSTPPEEFPSENLPRMYVNRLQHKQWLGRANKLANRWRHKLLSGKPDTQSEALTDTMEEKLTIEDCGVVFYPSQNRSNNY